MCARRKGISLLEVLCASVLSLLLFSVVLSVLLPAFKASGQVGARVEMEQQVSVVLARMTRELQRTRPSSLAYWEGNTGSCLSLHCVEGVSLGDPPVAVYSRQLIFYYFSKSTGRVVRSVWPSDLQHPVRFDAKLLPPDGSVPVQPDSSTLGAVIRSQLEGQQLASLVQTFRVTSPAGELSSPLTINLELSRNLAGKSQPSRFRLSQVVSIRSTE